MADRITINYQENGSVKFKVRKQFKDHKYQFDSYWEEYWKTRFTFFSERCLLAVDDPCPTKAKTPPKLRKKQFYPHEWAYYNSEPKWWRKLKHVKPFRRANKNYIYQMTEMYTWESELSPFGFELFRVHPYEGLPEPLWNKPHVYYW